MTETQIKGLLADYSRGLLDTEKQAFIQKHLESCETCRQALKFYESYYHQLSRLDPIKAPINFSAKLHHRLAGKSLGQKLKQFFFQPLKIKLPLELAGVLTVCIMIFVILNPVFHQFFNPEKIITENSKNIALKSNDQNEAVNNQSSETKTDLTVIDKTKEVADNRNNQQKPLEKEKESLPASEINRQEKAPDQIPVYPVKIVLSMAIKKDTTGINDEKQIEERSFSRSKSLADGESLSKKSAEASVNEKTIRSADMTSLFINDKITMISDLIKKYNGIVLPEQSGTDLNRMISFTLPSQAFSSFFEELKTIGNPQDFPENLPQVKSSATVEFKLELITK